MSPAMILAMMAAITTRMLTIPQMAVHPNRPNRREHDVRSPAAETAQGRRGIISRTRISCRQCRVQETSGGSYCHVWCPISKTSGTTSNILLLNSGILVISTKPLVLPTAPVHKIWLVRRVQCVGMGIASPIAWSDLPKVKGESSHNRLIGHLVDNQADNVKWTMLLVK